MVKNHGRGGSPRGFTTEEALTLKAVLDRKAAGSTVELLCVDRLGCDPSEFEPRCAGLGVHKRLLEGFAPGERAYLYDLPGWARIFAEFDSLHSPFPEAGFEERAQAIQRHLEARRDARLRDIRDRSMPCR